MATLTTSQLTFYDYKDSYHVEINPDCIIVNCDEKCISTEVTNVSISYGIYCGNSRVNGTASVDLTINNEKINATVINCAPDKNGTITFSIPANVNFANIDSVHITFSELKDGDGDTFTFDKYIQFIKAVSGASGTGLIFKVYSEDGTAFREDMTQINLETVVYVGESFVNASNYTWEYFNDAEWVALQGNLSTFTVNKTDAWAFKTIRCTIEYSGIKYYDYISLTDDVVIYSSEIKYFNGSNVFKNTDKYLIAYMALYKNGEEIDPLQSNQFAEATSVNSSNLITTTVSGTFTNGQLLYFVIPDSTYATSYSIILGEYNGSKWYKVNMIQEYIYQNSKSSESNKIIVISKEQVNKTLAISFSAYKKSDEVLLSSADGNVVDLNDPIVSGIEPSNPIDGQLWVDTSRAPYVIKVCKIDANGNVEWTDSTQLLGGVVYTSKPSSYNINDVWILNDGESCFYTKNSVYYNYGPGSMLRATESSTSFNASHWTEIKSELTELRDNVAQYFEFNSESGLKIGQKDQKFYVNISATEMGFYDNSNSSRPNEKVVSIGNQAAKIKNLTVEESSSFSCNVDFNNSINIYNPYKTTETGFKWQFEPNGSFSFVVIK